MTSVSPPPRPAVLAEFLNGAPHIAQDPRFTRHQFTDTIIDWDAVLAEPDWSTGQRVLIRLAAALTGNHTLPTDALSASLTGRQTNLVLAMCRAAHC